MHVAKRCVVERRRTAPAAPDSSHRRSGRPPYQCLRTIERESVVSDTNSSKKPHPRFGRRLLRVSRMPDVECRTSARSGAELWPDDVITLRRCRPPISVRGNLSPSRLRSGHSPRPPFDGGSAAGAELHVQRTWRDHEDTDVGVMPVTCRPCMRSCPTGTSTSRRQDNSRRGVARPSRSTGTRTTCGAVSTPVHPGSWT